ncbi:MAG: caspase family protein [Myxococcaceae bacterium]|nr:caspase family protein [Myxococcaceae bacterium]
MRRVLAITALVAASCASTSLEKGASVVRLSPGQVDPAFEPRRFALVVGIPASTDERWRALKYATKDVDDVARVLKEPFTGRFTVVTTLTAKKDTTKQALLAAVQQLATQATRPDDIVVIYVSAHGTLARDGRGEPARYLVTSDADFSRVAQTALSIEQLQQAFARVPSKRRVLVLATCHSGGGKSLLSDEMQKELASLKGVRPLEEVSRASIVLSASDFGEPAREDDGLKNDVYTHFLVEALQGPGDRNGDGAVTATEAHDFARRKTYAHSKGRQRPSAELVEVGADPVILAGRIQREGRPEVFSYAPRLDGFALKVNGEERAELPGGVAVTPGKHVIELTKGPDLFLKEEVTLEVGQRLDLEDLVTRKEPAVSLSALFGGFGFFDEKSRNEVLPGGATLGAALRVDRLFGGRFALEVDLGGLGGQTTLDLGSAPVPVSWTSVQGGVSLGWTFRWRFLSVYVGPRVAGLWVQRSFSVATYSGRQAAFTLMPGAWVGGAVALGKRWEVSAHLQPTLSVLTVDGTLRAMGFVSGWAAVGFKF